MRAITTNTSFPLNVIPYELLQITALYMLGSKMQELEQLSWQSLVLENFLTTVALFSQNELIKVQFS